MPNRKVAARSRITGKWNCWSTALKAQPCSPNRGGCSFPQPIHETGLNTPGITLGAALDFLFPVQALNTNAQASGKLINRVRAGVMRFMVGARTLRLFVIQFDVAITDG